MKFLSLILLILAASIAPAAAQTIELPCVTYVSGLSSGACMGMPNSLTQASWSGYTQVIVDGYYYPGDGGAGSFAKNGTSCTSDGGSVVTDSSGNCWYRDLLANNNFGLINVLEFGCRPELVDTSGGYDNAPCFTKAQNAALANHLAGINVCGNANGNQWDLQSTFVFTATVTCPTRDVNRPETQGSGLPSDGDFRSYPYSIRVESTGQVTCGVDSNHTNSTSGSSGKMDGINILRSGLNMSGAAPTSIQNLWDNKKAYSGIGLIIKGDGCQFSDGNILGFDTGIDSNIGAREFSLYNYKVDATNCRKFESQRGGGTITSVNGQCSNLVTELTQFSSPNLAISDTSGISDSGGEILITLNAACPTDSCPELSGQDGWITQPYGAQSANGEPWLLDEVDSSHWLLHFSTSAFLLPAGQSFTNVSYPTNSTLLTLVGVSTQCPVTTIVNAFCQVQPGQQVRGSCITSGTTVVAVWYDYAEVAISQPTTCSGSGATITLNDVNPLARSVTSVELVNGGSLYAANPTFTVSGGTCPIPPQFTSRTTSGVVTSVALYKGGSCTTLPSNPATATPDSGGGSGIQVNLRSSGNLSLSAGVREGIGTYIGNTISLSETNSFTNGYRNCLVFDGSNGSSANSTVISPSCFSNQALQDNLQYGIIFNSLAQANTVIGGTVHYFGGDIVSRAAATANMVANRVIGTSIGGNETNSGPNQILFIDESSSRTTASHARLELEGLSSQSTGYAFVSADTLSLGVKDSMLANTLVFCEPGAQLLVNTTGSTLDPGSCVPQTGNAAAMSGLVNANPTTPPYATTNGVCGRVIGSAGYTTAGPLPVLLPPLPVVNCRFWLIDDATHGFLIDPNGSNVGTALGNAAGGPILIAPTSNLFTAISIVFNGTRWMIDSGDPDLLATNSLINGPRAANGQVRLEYESATSVKLCPYNGPGGLINRGVLVTVPQFCVHLPNTSTTGASRANFVYFDTSTVTITGASDGGGFVRLKLSSVANLVNGDPITVAGVLGSPGANGTFAVSNVNTGTNEIDLLTAPWINYFPTPTPPAAKYEFLVATNTAAGNSPVQDPVNGIQVENGVSNRTFVGAVWMDSTMPTQQFSDSWTTLSGCSLDVASFYNPLIKTGTNHFTASRSVTLTTLAEINPEIECDYVDITVNGEPRVGSWSFAGTGSNSTAGDGANTVVGFDGSATEPTVSYTSGVASQPWNVSSSGTKVSTATHHVVSVYGAVTGGGTATWPTSDQLAVSVSQ